MKKCKTVEEYLDQAENFQNELIQLRAILQKSDLKEEVKWGSPCYTFDGKNVVGMGAFKSYFGLWFYQGALLTDPNQVLINAQEGKTKALRQWRMNAANEIKPRVIQKYVKEATALVIAGKEIKPDRSKSVDFPPELNQLFKSNSNLKKAFEQLTPGKQREYTEYISSAKLAKTKESRLEKITPLIESGVGLHDKYRNC